MTALYKDGTITLVNGSPVITGNDTAWAVSLIVGGTVFVEVDGGNPLPILPDDGGAANLHPITDTQMTSAINWTGPSGTFNYALVRDMSYTRQQSINAEKLGDLLSQLDHPLLAALSSIEGLQDHLILLTGPSTATIIPRSALVEGVDYDVAVNTLADLAIYSGEAKDFSVLVANAGDGRAALYIKRSNTDGDWVNPAFITGAPGTPGDPGPFTTLQMGDTTTLNPGQAATVTMVPVSPGVVRLDFGLPRGQNGTGTGDVVGPNASVNNRVVVWDGVTGKVLKDSGVVLGNAASRNIGTAAGTVAAGDDVRFSQGGSSQNEALMALAIADLQGYRLGMKNGVADAFDDETGVDVKTNAVYDAANDWYSPVMVGGVDSNTVIMLHGDGADNSTVFTDSAIAPNTFTAVADAKIKTDQSVFGAASMRFDGVLDRITCPDSAALRPAGDFTLDFRIRFASGGAFQTIYDKGYVATGSLLIQSDNSALPKIVVYSGSTAIVTESGAGSALNTWYHYAIVKSGGTVTVYKNGVSVGSASMPAAVTNTGILAIGARQSDGTSAFNGWLDELRFSSVARWTAPFTPPTEAYAAPLSANMTLVSVAYPLSITPSTGRLCIQTVETDAIVPNTDVIAELTRDGGATWTPGVLSLSSSFVIGGYKIYEAVPFSLVSQPSGSSMKWRVRTLNNKNVAISGVCAQGG